MTRPVNAVIERPSLMSRSHLVSSSIASGVFVSVPISSRPQLRLRLLRLSTVALLAVLLASCFSEQPSIEKGEKEPAPLRKPQWSVQLDAFPVVARVTDDAVVVVTEGGVVVLDRRSGKKRWSQPTSAIPAEDIREVFVSDGTVVVSGPDLMVGYGLTDGRELFRIEKLNRRFGGPGVTHAGILTVNKCTWTYCEISLYNWRTGATVWHRQFPAQVKLLPPTPADVTPGWGGTPNWRGRMSSYSLYGVPDMVDPLRPAPGTEAFVVLEPMKESKSPVRVARIDVRTGAVLGSFEAPQSMTGSNWDGLYLITDNVLLIGNDACGNYSAYDVRTGIEKWSKSINQLHLEHGAVRFATDPKLVCKASPTVVDGNLLANASDGELQVLDVSSGYSLWMGSTKAAWLGYDDDVAVSWTAPHGAYSAVDTKTGKKLWTHEPPWLQDRRPNTGKRELMAYAVAYRQVFYSVTEQVNSDPLSGGFYDGDYRTVTRVLDLRTGQPLWAAEGDNRLLGVGTNWVVTASVDDFPRDDSTEIRLFRR